MGLIADILITQNDTLHELAQWCIKLVKTFVNETVF
jgi:hypothetical protein